MPEGHLLLQTVRSHDQFNTTIYGLDDRYRGIKQGRRVVFVNPVDRETLGIAEDAPRRPGQRLRRRRATGRGLPGGRLRDGAGLRGGILPETNVLVAPDSVARVSNTPVSKSIVVRLEPRTEM